MRAILCLLILSLAVVIGAAAPVATNLPPTPIVLNRSPLVTVPFSALPLGSVRPLGWLLKQCQLQRDGLTGNAEALYANDLGTNSGWLGGTGDSWERSPYYYKGLVALAYTLNDPGLKQKAQKWMDWLLNNQGPDGYLGPTANNDWWPRMVATYALEDYYEATADPRVPTVLSNYFHYMLMNLPSRPLQDWGESRGGDEMAVALWLYNRNGDNSLLSLATLLRQQIYNWPGIFSSNAFLLYGSDFQPKHNVNVEQALKMPLVYYQLQPTSGNRAAVNEGWTNLMREDALSFGINSGTEFLGGNSSIQGVELCAIVEAMLSLETDVRISGDPAMGDRLETIAFNALPAALTPNIRGLQYFTLANNVIAVTGGHGFVVDYDNATVPGPYSGFPCCRYDFHMGWPKFIQNSWGATPDGGLALLTYGPMVVNAMAGGTQVQITEDTGYPFEEQSRLQISVSNSVTFPLVLRIPGWCSNATVTVNGAAQSGVQAGSFYRVSRKWSDGDRVVINLPMSLRTVTGPSRAVAISRGPVVYSLSIGELWATNTPDALGLGFDTFQITPTSRWNYALQLDPFNPAASLTFTNYGVPVNPFDPAEPSQALLAKGRLLPDWTVGWIGTQAFEPPVSPVASASGLTDLKLVPFGSQRLRVSWFPYLGTPLPTAGYFNERFDRTWDQRWTTFGGNWIVQSNALTTVPASQNGVKAVEMASAFTNFTYEGDVSVGPSANAGLIFRVSRPDIGADAYCGYYAGIDATGGQLQFGYASNGWHQIATAPMAIAANTFYHLKVQAEGTRIRVFVTNTNVPVLDLTDGAFASGMIGVRIYSTDGNQCLSGYSNLVATEFPAAAGTVPQAWYRFEGNALDASGWGNDGTISGNVTFGPGKVGALAAQFDGSTGTAVSIPLCVSNSFTIAFWLKTSDTGGVGAWYNGKGLVDGEVSGVANDFGISLIGNTVAFGVGNPDTTIWATNAVINDGSWHHVAATRDAVSGAMCLYLDGALQAGTIGPPGPRTAPPGLRIGSLQTETANGFLAGAIDDVQIFGGAISPGEVPFLMNHTPSLSPVSSISIPAGLPLLVTNVASDPDLPAETLTYRLSTSPAGMTINPTNGLISWRPAIAQAGADYPVTVSLANNGSPAGTATTSFNVSVLSVATPQIGSLAVENGLVQLTVNGDAGPDYSILESSNLASTNWTMVQTVTGAAPPFSFTDAPTNSLPRFYRVRLGP